MLRKSIGATTVALGTVLATGVAAATPPYGLFTAADTVHRGPAVGAATVNVKPGTTAYLGSYSLAPGSTAGWRAQPGLSLLALKSGSLKVVQAKGCEVRAYTAPEVAVIPAGIVHVGNTGEEAAEFVGYFDGLGKGAGRPLVDGGAGTAPRGCSAATFQAASVGVAAAEIASGVFAPIHQTQGHSHIAQARAKVPDGADITMIHFKGMTPGTVSGWYRHAPGMAFLVKGRFETYTATENGCAKVEEYTAGEAISHVHHDLHYTAVPADTAETTEFVIVYWGMANNRNPQPGLVDFAEANDFSPMPPPGCTKF